MIDLAEELSMIRNWKAGCNCAVCCAVLIGKLERRLKKHNQLASATLDRKTRSLKDWAILTGIPYKILSNRKSRGWPDRKIIETPYKPARKPRTIKYKRKKKTCAEWAAESTVPNMTSEIIRARFFHCGWTAHKTLTEPVRPRAGKAAKTSLKGGESRER